VRDQWYVLDFAGKCAGDRTPDPAAERRGDLADLIPPLMLYFKTISVNG